MEKVIAVGHIEDEGDLPCSSECAASPLLEEPNGVIPSRGRAFFDQMENLLVTRATTPPGVVVRSCGAQERRERLPSACPVA